jgi:hypothetical protein
MALKWHGRPQRGLQLGMFGGGGPKGGKMLAGSAAEGYAVQPQLVAEAESG